MLRVAEHGLMVRLRALLDFADYSRRPGVPPPAASRFGSCVGRGATDGQLAMIWDNFNALDSPLRSIAQVLCHRRRHQKRRRQDDSSDSGVGRARAATGTTDPEADPTSLGEIIHPYLPLALRWQ
jgi:hypothetical protein